MTVKLVTSRINHVVFHLIGETQNIEAAFLRQEKVAAAQAHSPIIKRLRGRVIVLHLRLGADLRAPALDVEVLAQPKSLPHPRQVGIGQLAGVVRRRMDVRAARLDERHTHAVLDDAALETLLQRAEAHYGEKFKLTDDARRDGGQAHALEHSLDSGPRLRPAM